MLHCLCGSPSILLSFTLASVLPRRYTYRVSYGTAIYAFHRYTWNSVFSAILLDTQFQMQLRGWAPEFHVWLTYPPTHPLRPVIPTNACTLRITAAAGTELAGASFPNTLKVRKYYSRTLVLRRQNFTTRRPSSFTRRRFIRLSPIVKYSRLLPPVGVWAVSQSQCWRSISQSA